VGGGEKCYTDPVFLLLLLLPLPRIGISIGIGNGIGFRDRPTMDNLSSSIRLLFLSSMNGNK